MADGLVRAVCHVVACPSARRPVPPVRVGPACRDDTRSASRSRRDKQVVCPMRKALQTGGELAAARTHGDNAPQPVRSLRDWLDHLAARDRLVVVKPGTGLASSWPPSPSVSTGARNAVPASGRTPYPGGLRPRVRSRTGSPRQWASSRVRCWRAFRTPRSIRSRGGRREIGAGAGGRPSRGRSRASCFRCRLTTSTTVAPTSRPA